MGNSPEEGIADDGLGFRAQPGHWRKSSFSMSNGDCVEVAMLPGDHVGVRDSKATTGPHLRFQSKVWTAFLRDIHGTQVRNR